MTLFRLLQVEDNMLNVAQIKSSFFERKKKKKHGEKKKSIVIFAYNFFLAHLSTTCSREAFRMVWCPVSIVRHAPSKIFSKSFQKALFFYVIISWDFVVKGLRLFNDEIWLEKT